MSKEEIQQMVEEAAKTGALARARQRDRLARPAVREAECGDVMIPRNRIDALPINAKPDDPALPAGGAPLAHPRL